MGWVEGLEVADTYAAGWRSLALVGDRGPAGVRRFRGSVGRLLAGTVDRDRRASVPADRPGDQLLGASS
jgi:hypothetical protein